MGSVRKFVQVKSKQGREMGLSSRTLARLPQGPRRHLSYSRRNEEREKKEKRGGRKSGRKGRRG